ncbi:hypothetical protein H7H82_08330 [Mycobacterium heidelbergense]|uniref:hypothetical protein n=1 Tax=Mycobacterium heidelbergense TaxID=53376 RepID=UPI001154A411|nr:hypothetical protein [Mycobacterium heidelbergense]MCV7050601.1 hypothetical protein [Mycobacterium heidelbergense]BBZ50610.1 hypothetical protein MHEI_23270 [Mycobacterium heidelbergense]
MDLTARPHITAGITLASAAVLAAGPMAQHLPGLHLAQHLPAVSVSDINLTDASSALDLFSGVESELASIVDGASAAALPASLASAAFDPTQNLIIQTWMKTFSTAGANLQTLYNQWSAIPAPLLQQVLANDIAYGNLYVGTYQAAANAAVKYFTTPVGVSFQRVLNTALADLNAGNLTGAYTNLWSAFVNYPFTAIFQPLNRILGIPIDITKNLSNATNYLLNTNATSGVSQIGLSLLNFVNQPGIAFSASLQAALNAWNAEDPVVAVTDLLNIPGAVTNAVLNGNAAGQFGLISTKGSGLSFGPVETIGIKVLQNVATNIVAPNAANIMSGQSLQAAFQGFVNTLTNGWPSLTPVVNDLSAGLTQVLNSIPSIVANLPSILGKVGGFVSGQVGLLIANLLKLL